MPFYDYMCSKCEHTFEEMLKISERSKPCKKACPNCGAKKSVQQVILQAPAACDPIRVGKAGKVDSGFREVISKIKKAHPRNSMRDY